MWRLEKDQGAGLSREFGHTRAPFAESRGQEPFERESFGRQAGDAERSGNGRRSRHRDHGHAFLRDTTHELEARVRQQRRPRIAHQRNTRAGAQFLQQFVDSFAFVVFMQRHQRARQPECCQQLPCPARVFRRDQFGGREFIARARRQVAKIADGRRDHRKTPQVRCHYTSPPRQDARHS